MTSPPGREVNGIKESGKNVRRGEKSGGIKGNERLTSLSFVFFFFFYELVI